mmetsp:Transcript_11242/g.45722  ORF Transcript_11242/g.45722 Transcript_11242/m.45722 type:complete len:519 (+) Transcript_11242:96-1652(+)|eukprot:CAMPEP_0114626106 /NCGR_PEP_ID=MMETSP0168-20121206/11609_1 /TAXON_ID=95228 ORGANISM="Vannella sp., Strain DIVA3 517/6/12" /NCGR_SAMPLE_ID=MMETSP0168 /ASSEMBLY_ACC=CAM_ASM_000044 /LENGTH=518 /DNA_ID=CAMNT_0001837397 /DNA_START=12 /DNA_END=1568 /DNA_ORIENTATION=+
MALLWVLAFVAVLLAVVLWDLWSFRRVPPGPKGLPVIGLLPSQMKMAPLHLTYSELCRKYGGMVSLKMGNTLTVVVGSKSSLRDVLFSKGAAFAHRPYRRSYAIRSKGQTGIGFCTYSFEWKERRKVLHQTFFKGSVVNDLFQERIYKSVNDLLTTLHSAADSGEGISLHEPIRLETSNVIFSVLNGRKLAPDDPEFELRKKFAELNGILQGKFTVGDYFPQLQRFSDDDEAFQKFQELTDLEMAVHWDSIQAHRKRLEEREAAGGAKFDDEHEKDLQDILIALQDQEKEEQGRNVLFHDDAVTVISSEVVAGGTDTQAAAMQWFIVALCNYPEIQQKLQEEIDHVLQGATPTGEDRKRLPYMNSVLNEVYRRWTILPLALPHMTATDIVVDGYRIPAGTTVIANQWALNHDPEIWPEPSKFMPERFKDMTKQELDNVMLSFGRGARVCPGKPLADIQICIVLATIIQRFHITPVLEDDTTMLDEEGVPGLIFFPKPFKVQVERRKTMYPTPDLLPVH